MKSLYDRLIIYCFSGTGNALRASEWIVKNAQNEGISATIIRINDETKPAIENIDGKTLIGFVYATHGFNAPPLMLEFISLFPSYPNADVFLVNTRGGMKLYKIFTPGLSGAAQFLPALILRTKGYRIVGMQPLDLPSNWISLHPGIRTSVVNSIHQRCSGIMERFSQKILTGKRVYTAFWSLPFDLSILPITFLYYLFARFCLSKTFVANHTCTSCGRCVRECPVKALNMNHNRPYWKYNCESCMHCMNICPSQSIQTPHGFVIAVWIGLISFLLPYLQFLVFDTSALGIDFGVVVNFMISEILISMVLFMLLFFLIYRLLHYLMRFKIVSYLITFTSFSHYTFWRRYYAPKKM